MQPRFDHAVEQLSVPLQKALDPLLAAGFAGMLSDLQVAEIKQQTGLSDDALSLALLPLAAACAQAGLSHFNVGAIAQGISGYLYFGANMEFAGSPLQQTVHAEQSAISHAWMRGEKRLVAVTVNYSPCGHCRQFMNELNSGLALSINLPGRAPCLLGDYLPDAFGPADLNMDILLFDEINHGFSLQGDAVAQLAISAANRSYAPYSKAPSGVTLQLENGQLFSGSYAENAAFNPSLPPLQVALNTVNLSGHPFSTISRAVLAERADAPLTQWDATVATLTALGCHKITRIFC